MFVFPSRLKTQGAVAMTVGALTLLACADPTARTDLRPDGPPEVLSVLVYNDGTGGFIETATYCKVGDEKRPSLVGLPDFTTQQVCDADLTKGADPVTDAVPTGWSVRIMFDELLDATIEDLIPVLDPDTMEPTDTYTGTLARTQPVTLMCGGVAVPYDGYYSPSGNNVTWPLGPSLVIRPEDPTSVATGTECSVTLKTVIVDKSGTAVPSGDLGPYTFTIAPLEFIGSAPEPADPGDEDVIVPDAAALLFFNTAIDATSLTAAEISILEVADCAATVGTARTAVIEADAEDPTAIAISMAGAPAGQAWTAESFFLITFADGAEVADVAGGTATLPGADDFSLCFGTDTAQ